MRTAASTTRNAAARIRWWPRRRSAASAELDVRARCEHGFVRPLRLAVWIAIGTALAIALGQLWLRSLDGRRVPSIERAARAGSDAVGVAIAGLNGGVTHARGRGGSPVVEAAARARRPVAD